MNSWCNWQLIWLESLLDHKQWVFHPHHVLVWDKWAFRPTLTPDLTTRWCLFITFRQQAFTWSREPNTYGAYIVLRATRCCRPNQVLLPTVPLCPSVHSENYHPTLHFPSAKECFRIFQLFVLVSDLQLYCFGKVVSLLWSIAVCSDKTLLKQLFTIHPSPKQLASEHSGAFGRRAYP